MSRHATAGGRKDTIRLIFPVFKDLKDAEAQAVKTLVQSLTTEYAGVEFAFLHIIEDHDWMMYDLSSPGVGEGSRAKGKCVPVRGHAVPISRSQMLITTTGPRELKTATQGAPQPLLIQLFRESTFTDLDYLDVPWFRHRAYLGAPGRGRKPSERILGMGKAVVMEVPSANARRKQVEHLPRVAQP